MEQIRVLIVDDNHQLCEMISDGLRHQQDMYVSGIAHDGEEALAAVRNACPDVVLLDLVMPRMDGFTFLERLSDIEGPKPRVVVLSALGQDEIVLRTMQLGASYYLLKPCDMEVIARRIREAKQGNVTPFAKSMRSVELGSSRSLDEKITSLFLSIGIPAHIKGYHFLREAIKLAVVQPQVMDRITKELYPTIACKFSTMPGKVERAIRHAIDVVWTRGKVENLNHAFGIQIYNGRNRPTNSEFVALIADRLILEQSA